MQMRITGHTLDHGVQTPPFIGFGCQGDPCVVLTWTITYIIAHSAGSRLLN